MPNINQQIREICIYHSDDGTSGFLLSEKQLEKIFDLVEGEREKIKKIVQERQKYVKSFYLEWKDGMENNEPKITISFIDKILTDILKEL